MYPYSHTKKSRAFDEIYVSIYFSSKNWVVDTNKYALEMRVFVDRIDWNEILLMCILIKLLNSALFNIELASSFRTREVKYYEIFFPFTGNGILHLF